MVVMRKIYCPVRQRQAPSVIDVLNNNIFGGRLDAKTQDCFEHSGAK
jgi:hypothetical protein